MKEVEESPLIDDKWKLIYIRMSHRILQMEGAPTWTTWWTKDEMILELSPY